MMRPQELDFGWVFFYDAGDEVIAGNAPIIVDRDAGCIHITGTARPLAEYLEACSKRLVFAALILFPGRPPFSMSAR